MGYGRLMGYGKQIPMYQIGGLRFLWGMGGYGLYPLWVKRGPTVFPKTHSEMRTSLCLGTGWFLSLLSSGLSTSPPVKVSLCTSWFSLAFLLEQSHKRGVDYDYYRCHQGCGEGSEAATATGKGRQGRVNEGDEVCLGVL